MTIVLNKLYCATNNKKCDVLLTKQMKARFGLTMSPELLKRIDEKRGLIARATYIEYCMKRYFELEDLRSEEIKFYKEMLGVLRDLISEKKRSDVLSGITLIISKISERVETLISTK